MLEIVKKMKHVEKRKGGDVLSFPLDDFKQIVRNGHSEKKKKNISPNYFLYDSAQTDTLKAEWNP